MGTCIADLLADHVCWLTCRVSTVTQVLKKKDVSIGLTDKVSIAQFCEVWRLLGLPLPANIATAMFNKYGQDAAGRLPVTVSCRI